jgi:hypothetical protein
LQSKKAKDVSKVVDSFGKCIRQWIDVDFIVQEFIVAKGPGLEACDVISYGNTVPVFISCSVNYVIDHWISSLHHSGWLRAHQAEVPVGEIIRPGREQ